MKSSEDIPRAQRLLDSAQGVWLISNSIRATVRVFPEFRVKDEKNPPKAERVDVASDALVVMNLQLPRQLRISAKAAAAASMVAVMSSSE